MNNKNGTVSAYMLDNGTLVLEAYGPVPQDKKDHPPTHFFENFDADDAFGLHPKSAYTLTPRRGKKNNGRKPRTHRDLN